MWRRLRRRSWAVATTLGEGLRHKKESNDLRSPNWLPTPYLLPSCSYSSPIELCNQASNAQRKGQK
eukprot:1626445-Amphidinium_carterae.1